MEDQQILWDKLHQQGVMDGLRHVPSDYVKSAIKKMPQSVKILELGCGTGGDAQFLKGHGHHVVATDFSEAVITENKKAFPDIHFEVLDTSSSFPFGNESFDIVYANLSLHYFDDKTTEKIFRDIYRVLKQNGLIIFRCKSIYSQSEKQGASEIAPNIYLQRVHLRHLFSTEYVDELFEACDFKTIENKYTQGLAYGKQAYFVEAIGEKL